MHSECTRNVLSRVHFEYIFSIVIWFFNREHFIPNSTMCLKRIFDKRATKKTEKREREKAKWKGEALPHSCTRTLRQLLFSNLAIYQKTNRKKETASKANHFQTKFTLKNFCHFVNFSLEQSNFGCSCCCCECTFLT